MDTKIVKELEKVLDEKLEPINEKLDSLTLDMAEVQKKTDILPDILNLHKGTNTKVQNHEERIRALEQAA